MKISNVVLISMITASLSVSCKNNNQINNKSLAELEKIKQDSIKKVEAEKIQEIGQNCPACGMG